MRHYKADLIFTYQVRYWPKKANGIRLAILSQQFYLDVARKWATTHIDQTTHHALILKVTKKTADAHNQHSWPEAGKVLQW